MCSWWCSVVLQRGLQLGDADDSAGKSLRSAVLLLTNGYNEGFLLAIPSIERRCRWMQEYIDAGGQNVASASRIYRRARHMEKANVGPWCRGEQENKKS
jgi:hypothetical protein